MKKRRYNTMKKKILTESEFRTVWTVTNKLKHGMPVSDHYFDESIKILDDFNPNLSMDNLNGMAYYYGCIRASELEISRMGR